MAPIATAIETFEGEAKRILWLPPITLGYIFTLSGYIVHFALAVAAIGGARLFVDILDSDLVEKSDDGDRIREDAMDFIRSNYSGGKLLVLALFAVIYFISIVYGLFELYLYFNHDNPVLVGIAGVYWGILVVILMNF